MFDALTEAGAITTSISMEDLECSGGGIYNTAASNGVCRFRN